MKKTLFVFLAVIMLIFMASFTSVGLAKAESVSFSESGAKTEIKDFVTAYKDRTPFSEGESDAAQYLKDRLTGYGYQAEINSYTASEIKGNYVTPVVSAVYASEGLPDDAKYVVIGANIDNSYSSISEINFSGNQSEGAFDNATGVAAVLLIAGNVISAKPNLPYKLLFAFFGGGQAGGAGSTEFVKNYFDSSGEILAMFDIRRAAGGTMYIYNDETDTPAGNFVLEKASGISDAEFQKMPRTVPLIPDSYAGNLSYSHYGLYGDNAAFFEKGITSFNIFGGDITSFEYFTIKSDTFDSFAALYPSYGKTIAAAAQLVYDCVTDSGFYEAANSEGNSGNYWFFMGGNLIYPVQLAIIIALAAALIVAVKKLEKKYPIAKSLKKVRVAVFGTEYEERKKGEILLDIKRQDGQNDTYKENSDESGKGGAPKDEAEKEDKDGEHKK